MLDDLTAKGYEFETAEVQMVPNTLVKLPEDKQTSMQKLLDALEDNDDVQNVWHNWDVPNDGEEDE